MIFLARSKKTSDSILDAIHLSLTMRLSIILERENLDVEPKVKKKKYGRLGRFSGLDEQSKILCCGCRYYFDLDSPFHFDDVEKIFQLVAFRSRIQELSK